jgi:hypothetical protein
MDAGCPGTVRPWTSGWADEDSDVVHVINQLFPDRDLEEHKLLMGVPGGAELPFLGHSPQPSVFFPSVK